jgi:hypothetical protein
VVRPIDVEGDEGDVQQLGEGLLGPLRLRQITGRGVGLIATKSHVGDVIANSAARCAVSYQLFDRPSPPGSLQGQIVTTFCREIVVYKRAGLISENSSPRSAGATR